MFSKKSVLAEGVIFLVVVLTLLSACSPVATRIVTLSLEMTVNTETGTWSYKPIVAEGHEVIGRVDSEAFAFWMKEGEGENYSHDVQQLDDGTVTGVFNSKLKPLKYAEMMVDGGRCWPQDKVSDQTFADGASYKVTCDVNER